MLTILGGIGVLAGPAIGQSGIPLTPTAQASGTRLWSAQGIDFVTVGSPGNAPWPGTSPPTSGDRAVGRGSVSYEFSIGRMEVTTAQWVEFFNAAYDRPADDRLPHLLPPSRWGAAPTPATVPGGLRWTVPAGNELMPVGNISWRNAAMYCNWLHNNKSTDRAAFLDGAYDVSTFSYTAFGAFNDQITRHTTARYWIPSWDEWLKAAHFDPNRHGPGQEGWWFYSHASDSPVLPGPPGTVVTGDGRMAEANFGWNELSFPGLNPFAVPLGAYPTVQSPWGLFDVAGATGEWTEEAFFRTDGFPRDRIWDGSFWGGGSGADRVLARGGSFPSFSGFQQGFRIATTVPGPGSLVVLVVVAGWHTLRRRRLNEVAHDDSGVAGPHQRGNRAGPLSPRGRGGHQPAN